MKFILTLIFVCIFFTLKGQIITTIAGNGIGTNSGDSGAASAASIYLPAMCIFDNEGNLYVSTSLTGNTIRKVSTSGVITTVAGITGVSGYSGDGGLAALATFKMPTTMAFDTSGNLYVTDFQAHVIRKIDKTTGIISTYAGTGVGGYSGDGGPATSAQLKDPGGIAIDKHNNLFIADRTNNRIRKVSPDGIISTYAGDGTGGYGGDGGPVSAAALSVSVAEQLAFDESGNLYIPSTRYIRKVSPSGIISTIAGTGTAGYDGDGGPASAAKVSLILLTSDRYGNIYFHDQSFPRLRCINTSGIINTVVGTGAVGFDGDGGPAVDALLHAPAGITTDSCGNLYICDKFNYRIRKVDFNPTCAPIVGVQAVQQAVGEVVVSPNPSYDEVTITAGTTLHSITLCNMAGQVVYTTTPTSKTTTIGISHLPAGIYILRADGVVKRVVKE